MGGPTSGSDITPGAAHSAGIESARDDVSNEPLGPVGESERLLSLDVLRGFAIFGILCMNIQWFAMPLYEARCWCANAHNQIEGVLGEERSEVFDERWFRLLIIRACRNQRLIGDI